MCQIYNRTHFAFAYGSPKKDPNRNVNITRKTGSNADLAPFSKVAGVTYIQPYIAGATDINNHRLEESISTYEKRSYRGASSDKKNVLLSVTDTFDEAFIKNFWQTTGVVNDDDDDDDEGEAFLSYYGEKFSFPFEKKDHEYDWNPDLWVYDFRNYLHNAVNQSKLSIGTYYLNTDKTYAKTFNTLGEDEPDS